MAAFVVLAVSLIGFLAVLAWIGLVSAAIRRDDRGAVLSKSAIGAHGTGPGRVARMSRQTTGVHWA